MTKENLSRIVIIGIVIAFAWSCGGGGGTAPSSGDTTTLNLPAANFDTTTVAIQRAFPALTFASPVLFLQAPDNPDRWYVVEKAGVVRTFTTAATQSQVFVDLRDRVNSGSSEAGLLGMAFHPQYAQNRAVYLSYTANAQTPGAALTSYIVRLTASADGTSADSASAQTILTVDQPELNHKGGHIAFGPDGFLYIGFGDGGANSSANGQNTHTLLGKILRIDVDGGAPYVIPADNPFANDTGSGRPEIYAWGLRNPWRWSFDRGNSAPDLWAGDVGENTWEEVDRIQRGGNYGWSVREGMFCHPADVTACAHDGMIDPIVTYGHDANGGIAIIGGAIYRGDAIPALRGAYVYGDFGNGRIWGLGEDAAGKSLPKVISESGLRIASFAQDAAGELYIVDFRGMLYKIVPGAAAAP